MIDYKMQLSPEHVAILNGEKGETMRKILETVVIYGDTFGAKRLVKVTHNRGHLVTSFGMGLLKPTYWCFDELVASNLKVSEGFTMDPRPTDFKNVKCNAIEKFVFNILYSKQESYEEQLKKVGLLDDKSFTCTCYLEENENTPKYKDIIAWSESSAVNFANSVLGARCNRNSGMIDVFQSILGYVPEYGLLLDENRKATWVVEVKTSKIPEAQILGSAIGIKVMDAVPYVKGLDKFLGTELDEKTISYLKDFGAATASNGAVGLYHIDNITPEAKELKEDLIAKGAKIYVIDDEELERVYKSYPNMWKKQDAKPQVCFIGCPHLTYYQLLDWHKKLKETLKEKGLEKVTCQVIFNSAPKVIDKLIKLNKDVYDDFYKMGATISSICPLMYTSNPLVQGKAIMTNSNKLRTYSMARYFKDEKVLDLISGGKY